MKVGFGQASILPKGGTVAIAGSIPPRFTEKAHDDIQCVAMILSQGDTRVVWVACDMCHPTKRLTSEVIQRLQEVLPGFREDELIFTATHATAYYYVTDDEYMDAGVHAMPEGSLPLPQLREQLCDAIVKAVLEADAAMTECDAAFSTAEVLTGYCRRVVYKDGTAAMYGQVDRADFLRLEYPDASGIQLLYFRGKANNRLLGVFAAVPSPAQADETGEYLTGDYWAVVRDRIAESLGVKVLGVCRSAGELTPHRMMPIDGSAREEEYGEAAARRVGNEIAGAILRELDRPKRRLPDDAVLRRVTTHVDFPIRQCTREEAAETEAYFADSANFNSDGSAVDWMRHRVCLFIRKSLQETDPVYPARVSALRLGPVLLYTAPAELFCEYARRVSARFPGTPVIDVQLANDCLGYLPTKEAMDHGGYSALPCNNFTTLEGCEHFVSRVTALLSELQSQ